MGEVLAAGGVLGDVSELVRERIEAVWLLLLSHSAKTGFQRRLLSIRASATQQGPAFGRSSTLSLLPFMPKVGLPEILRHGICDIGCIVCAATHCAQSLCRSVAT